jgi:hypothetical protein
MKNIRTNKFIVITTINSPSDAVRKYTGWGDWKVVVVGDRKTPSDWDCSGVTYLGIDKQYEEFDEISRLIPESTYTRKILGYLYAIRHGADVIFETDDDNIPYANAPDKIASLLSMADRAAFPRLNSESGWINIYNYFGAKRCWPRGFPIEQLKSPKSAGQPGKDTKPWGVVQFLADEDPDVDAVYRMVDGSPVYFARDRECILDEGTFGPINSQATLWTKESFPLLFLPLGVPDRVTDILRGYIALSCLWKFDRSVGYCSPIVYQKRNIHNLFNDFQQEMSIYCNANAWSKVLMGIEGRNLQGLYISAIQKLSACGAMSEENIHTYKMFLQAANISVNV